MRIIEFAVILHIIKTCDCDSFQFRAIHKDGQTDSISLSTKFMIYDVNPGEGFNLRRDVFIRAANLIRSLRSDGSDWVLVLPPWPRLYHWKSNLKQNALPWTTFFELKSISFYVPVIDFIDFIDITGSGAIDHLMFLQRHPNNFKNGGNFNLIDKDDCHQPTNYFKESNQKWVGSFWGLEDVFARDFNCYSVQGFATVLKDVLSSFQGRSVLVDRFESVMHISYGSVDFFTARRSMVYSSTLRNAANEFRKKYLDSNDEIDKTPYNSDDWQKQIPSKGEAKGGPYIAVHIRRGDFNSARKNIIPTIQEICNAVRAKLVELSIKLVFLATDGNKKEVEEFLSCFGADVSVHRFTPTLERVNKFYDGGIAIIDQWIAAHGRYFIGSCQSTFSFRIHEDRDILGFDPDTTYNCVCGAQSHPDQCQQPTKYWTVKFG